MTEQEWLAKSGMVGTGGKTKFEVEHTIYGDERENPQDVVGISPAHTVTVEGVKCRAWTLDGVNYFGSLGRPNPALVLRGKGFNPTQPVWVVVNGWYTGETVLQPVDPVQSLTGPRVFGRTVKKMGMANLGQHTRVQVGE